jgi:4-hydroxy-tetrahydrodipicolinate synthase
MPAADVCWAIVALWQALQSGDGETAERISGPLASLISLQASLGAFVAIEKHLLHRQGVLTNTTAREPLDYRLDPETAREAERLTDVLSAACRPEGHGMPRLGDRAASTAI